MPRTKGSLRVSKNWGIPMASRPFGLSFRPDPAIMIAAALMGTIVMMVLPMPSIVLDVGLALSFSLSILIFVITLFIQRPLDFSSFPFVLLASLMLRLSLNVSSTKLIIGSGHNGTAAAGQVIEGFAMFVMGGSVFLGTVIYLVLMIVNFVVISKGATRMAEVGARFALDGMPGKQLAIDGDMAAGAIDHAEAKRRREIEEAETKFFGSLDGASKFVKGDAVAGLLITALNFVMGLIMGIVVHGMDAGEAFATYSILTVGDGLVSQIPAVIISIGTGLLLTKGAEKSSVDVTIFEQFSRYPKALVTVAILMAFFALVPGLPALPFMVGAAILAFLAHKSKIEPPAEEEQKPASLPRQDERLGDLLNLDDLHIEFASDLVPMVLDPATGLEARITNMRNHIAQVYGLILPEIRLTDDPSLTSGAYRILIHGVEHGRGMLRPDQALLLLPEDQGEAESVKEPVYGAPAKWVERKESMSLMGQGMTVIQPPEILATHLLETAKNNFAKLLNLKSLRRLLDEFSNVSDPARSQENRRLLDELIPEKVPVDLLLATLRLLLEEKVSIRNLTTILEAIAASKGIAQSADEIAEFVRQKLRSQIVAGIKREDGSLPLIQLAPDWETRFAEFQTGNERLPEVALPPEDFNRLASAISLKVSEVGSTERSFAVITSARRRRFLKTVIAAKGLSVPVLSFDEIGPTDRPALIGQVAR